MSSMLNGLKMNLNCFVNISEYFEMWFETLPVTRDLYLFRMETSYRVLLKMFHGCQFSFSNYSMVRYRERKKETVDHMSKFAFSENWQIFRATSEQLF